MEIQRRFTLTPKLPWLMLIPRNRRFSSKQPGDTLESRHLAATSTCPSDHGSSRGTEGGRTEESESSEEIRSVLVVTLMSWQNSRRTGLKDLELPNVKGPYHRRRTAVSQNLDIAKFIKSRIDGATCGADQTLTKLTTPNEDSKRRGSSMDSVTCPCSGLEKVDSRPTIRGRKDRRYCVFDSQPTKHL